MATTELSHPPPSLTAIERVLVQGDLSQLSEDQRIGYYRKVCDSLGLNPLTRPFEYLTLNGKLILYARRDAAEQLRKIHGVSITDLQTSHKEGIYLVVASARDHSGRTDVSTGVVSIVNLRGEALANACMKAETKAKRRVTLSICGLGMLDESEVDAIDTTPQVPTPPKRIRVPEPEPEPDDEDDDAPLEDPDTDSPAIEEPTPAADDALRVLKVIDKTTRDGQAKWMVILSDGREVNIAPWKAALAAVAKQALKDHAAIVVETKRSKYGEDVEDLREAPLTAKAIPF